jgi:hypothetical protein
MLGGTAPVIVVQSGITNATSGTFSGGATLSGIDTAGLIAGQVYCDVTDGLFTNGEIRGQLEPGAAPIPALPASWWLLLVAAFGFAGAKASVRKRACAQ